jgi:3-methyladenine DNA glycosylase Tag
MHGHHVGKLAADHDYFERMSRVILVSGLNWRTLEKKWPGIKKAFASFDIKRVVPCEEPAIEALMANPEVIRSLPKIRATVANAALIAPL